MTFRLWHLALLLAVTNVIAAAGGAAATWWVADREFRDVLDEDLENQARMLAGLLARESGQTTATELQELLVEVFDDDDDEDTLWVTVHDLASGRQTSNLDLDISLAHEDNGEIRQHLAGYDWHGYQERKDSVVVQLLRRDDLYLDVQEEVLEEIVAPALVGSGVNLLLLALVFTLIIVPITRLAGQLEARSADSLTPLNVRTPAREIGVLRDALNNLVKGIDTVVARERRFAGDVAHELRTPLTTLKLELASGDPDLAALKSEVERMARLVEQLLTLARLEAGQWQQRFGRLRLADICTRVAGRFKERFHAAGMSCELRLSPEEVAGDATLLEILLQNLLQNALNHCPPGTLVDVELQRSDGGVCLRVSDTGPGIDAETRRRMSQGFTRLDSKSDGLGLGLAICTRIADVHGGSIRFLARDDGAAGLVVEVRFPS